MDTHLHLTREVANEICAGVLGFGFPRRPVRLDEVPVMPKGRYGIMRRYMPKVS